MIVRYITDRFQSGRIFKKDEIPPIDLFPGFFYEDGDFQKIVSGGVGG